MLKRLVQVFRDRQPDEARNIMAKDVGLWASASHNYQL